MRTLLILAVVLAGSAPGWAQSGSPGCAFVAGALPADTLAPGTPHGAAIPIQHIIVLMQENRSWDHYLARLPLRDADRASRRATNPDPLGGDPIKAFHARRLCEVTDVDHSWNGSHESWNGGAMDGFTAANVDPLDQSGRRTMGYYRKGDLPFYYKLYSTFAIGDRYFCSLLGPTFPNRHYLLAGTSFGNIRNNFPSSGDQFDQPTIFNLLEDAGVSWRIYQSDLAFALIYAFVRVDHPDRVVPIAQYFTDAAAGTLPQVAFIDPAFLGDEGNDEHPPRNVQLGQEFAARVIEALFTSPLWPSSAMFLVYDEHGGFWDHVPPPPACVPDAIPPDLRPTDTPAQFDRYGVRVPVAVVSPYAKRRFVSHVVHDHTSILRFIQTRFDLPALTLRDANADPMLEFFDFANPPFVVPPKLPAAKINPRKAAECP